MHHQPAQIAGYSPILVSQELNFLTFKVTLTNRYGAVLYFGNVVI